MKTVDKPNALKAAIIIATEHAKSSCEKQTPAQVLRETYKAIVKIGETIENSKS